MGSFKERHIMENSFRLKPILEPLSDLQKLMKKSGYPWMIIGGIASSLIGKPRFTADVDVVALIEDENISNILRLAKQFGFRPRIKNPAGFAKKNRVLLLQHKKSSINIDISLGLLAFEKEAIERSIGHKVGNVRFRLPAAEDLIIFKAVAHRPQDIMDIQGIVNNNPKLDVKYIKKIVNEFARALEMPEIWTDIKSIILTKKGHK
jgi:hypothetical protein